MLMRKRKPNIGGEKIYSHMWGPSEFKATGTLRNYDKVTSLKKITIPVLLICGEYDEATPKTVKRYHKLIKGSKFEVVKKASHCIALENPKDYLIQIKKFID